MVEDPEVVYSQGENSMAVANFRIASSRYVKKDAAQVADFFSCVAFAEKAEFIGRNFKKGSRLLLEGIMQNDDYVDKEGKKQYRSRIYVKDVDFADSKPSDNQAPAQTTQTQTYQRPAQTQATRQAAPAQAPTPAAPAQAPAKRTTTRKTAAPAQAPVQAPAQNGFMAIPEGMGDMPFFN